MATIQNERDKLLQAAAVRFIPPPLPQEIQDAVDATKGLSIVATGNQIKQNGSPSPASITFTVEFRLITGTVTWSVVQGTASLSVSGNTATLVASNMVTDRIRIRAALTVDGVTYTDEMDVTRVKDGEDGNDGLPGHDGDAVDIVFRRNPVQPPTPAASSGTPSGWFSSVDQVPVNSSPMWSSVGVRQGGTANYIWQEPLKVEGTDGAAGLSVAELTIYRRATSTPATPTGGSFNFGTQTLTPPSGWSWSVPSGTNPVYMSKAVVSVQGTTGSVGVGSGWTAPVLSMQNGANGTNGSDGTDGVRGTVHVSASASSPSWNNTTANSAITTFTGSSLRVKGDQVTLYNTSGGWAQTRYWNGSVWTFLEQVIDGNLVVTGTLTADKITAGTFTGLKFRTAASGRRIELDSSLNRITFFPSSGTASYIQSSTESGMGIDLVSPDNAYPVRILKEGASAFSPALTVVRQGTANAPALLAMGGSGPPIRLFESTTLPNDRTAGNLCYYAGWLCFANGSHWYRTDGTQLT